MTTTRRSVLRPLVLALGVVPLALTLAGCFGIPSIPGVPGLPGGDGPDGVNEDTVEEILEGQSGGDVDFEIGDLPADFPTGDIPLVPGEVQSAISVPGSDGKKGWQLNIFVADEAAAQEAGPLLEAAGFVEQGIGFIYENDAYTVAVLSSDAEDEGWYVGYTVAEK